MKKLSILLLLFFVFNTAFTQSKDEAAVQAAVEQLKKAMIDADKASLEKLTADNLSYGHSGGKVENKTEFIEALVSGKSDFATMDLTDQTVKITGNTAIVRHALSGNTVDGGKPNTVHLFVMLVWVKQGKQWKLLARQAVKQPS